MAFTDMRGLPVTAANAEAVRHYDDTVDAYLGFGLDTEEQIERVLAADPDMPIALCTKGYIYQLFSDKAPAIKATAAHMAAEAAAGTRGATARERSHIAALGAWCAQDLVAAVRTWEAILLEHPHDILALRLAHDTHTMLGDDKNLRDSVARVLPSWDQNMPHYGNVLGMYAFGLEEVGDYEAAESRGRRAVEINPADIWAAHAVAHVMEMQGGQREGIDWIRELAPNWDGMNNFVCHVWWHRCLFHLELEQYDAALAGYDNDVRAGQNEESFDICNATSLLWRLEEEGVDVGTRWQELADKSARRIDDHFLVFADLHYMMALIAGGREADVDRMKRSLHAAAAGSGTEAALMTPIAVPVSDAMRAYRRGDYGAAVDALLSIRYALSRIGGSHAQRDVFARMLISAARAAERFDLARALLAERTARRPNSPWSWKTYARALDGLGDRACAETARAQAAELLAT